MNSSNYLAKHEILVKYSMGTEPKTVQKLRTYKEDFLHAQETNKVIIPIKEERNVSTKIPAPQKKTVSTPPPIPPKPPEETREPVTQAPIENPPFHFIRESSLDTSEVHTDQKSTKHPHLKKTEVPQKQKTVSPEMMDVTGVQTASDLHSVLTSDGAVVNFDEEVETSMEGTIVTDKKQTRTKWVPAILASIKGWFTTKKAKRAKAQKAKYTVAAVDTRTDILEEAAQDSAHTPQDDYVNLTQKMADVERAPRTKQKISITKAAEIPKPTWSHTSDDTENAHTTTKEQLLAADKISTNEGYAARTAETRKTVQVVLSEQEVEEQAPVSTIKETQTALPEISVEEPAVEKNGPVQKEEPVVVPTVPREALPQTPPSITPLTYIRPSPFRVVGVILFATLLGISVSLWFFSDSDTIVQGTESRITTLVDTDTAIPVPFDSSFDTFIDNMLSVTNTTATITHLYPTIDVAGKSTPVSTTQILNAFAPHAPSGFIRSVADMAFGTYQGNQPFVVLKTTSFDTALSGMLEWEQTMSADFSPLFGSPVQGTFDQGARTATQIREPFFVDVIVANYDARLLQDENEENRLIYSFIDKNTILITTNQDTLEVVAPTIR